MKFALIVLLLALDGQPKATIVVDRQPTRAAQLASLELQYHVRRITGATLPIVGDDAPVRGARILVGESGATRALGLKSADFEPQEYLIHFRPDTLVLMGRDRDDRAKVDYAAGKGLPDLFDLQGTCYAVYDFLERFCDVRWYGPTELEMVHPVAKTFEVKGTQVRRKPAFSYRVAWPLKTDGMAYDLWNTPGERDMALFWRRMRLGGEGCVGNHSLEGFYDRFWKPRKGREQLFAGERPDWFAQGYEGKPPQLCYSNPEPAAQLAEDARRFFDGKGVPYKGLAQGDYFAVVPMDNSNYCKCPKCQGQIRHTDLSFVLDPRGGASDYVFGFVNEVARELGKTHPDKYIAALAYANYGHHPKHTRLEPNISVGLCLPVRTWWAPSVKRNSMKVYGDWVKNEPGRPFYLFLYYCSSGELPVFFAHTAAQQIKMFQRDGIKGAFLCGIAEQVDNYVTFRLWDDPSLDVDEMLDEFFERYYGEAAEPMKEFYLDVEKTVGDPDNYPPEVRFRSEMMDQTPEIAWGWLGNRDRMARWGELVQQAKARARGEVQKKRVAVFEQAVWNRMLKDRDRFMETGYAAFVKRLEQIPDMEALRKRPPPELTVPSVAPGAAGDPEKADWQRAAELTGWPEVTGYPTERKVTGRVLHDGEFLYVELCELGVGPVERGAAGDVWHADRWEIFFARRRAAPYRQFAVNAGGALFEQRMGEGNDRWDKPWDSGVVMGPNVATPAQWKVRMAFPLKTLLPGGVKPGSVFYANFCRATGNGRYLAWSANFTRSFHVLERMGKLALQ